MINASFSILLKNARKRAGMTQRQLADLSTISVRAIRDLELERTRAPRIQTVRLLADALRLGEARRAELEMAATGPVGSEPLIDELTAPLAPLGPIIGRDKEVASLTRLLETSGHRLITVVGMPGVGKTRLIQEVASALYKTGRMPAICLEQETVPADAKGGRISENSLISLIAGQVGCEPSLDDLSRTLAKSEILLTIDARHLDADGYLGLKLLLSRCPGLRVLYEACELSSSVGGVAFSVFPLAVPDWGRDEQADTDFATYDTDFASYPAVQFMRSHCAQLHPESLADRRVMNAITGICWYMDGVPAAIESAALWLLVYDPVQLLDTAARFPLLLTTSPSNSDDSLRSSLRRAATSLPSREAGILKRLAEAEPWTLEHAIGLVGGSATDALRGIGALRARGLVRRIDSVEGQRPRFAVLNLVRHVLRSDNDPVSP
jgi:transcriptional regulator with XRE-family HTH domain